MVEKITPSFCYAIVRFYSDGVNCWESINSIWLDKTAADCRCIDLNARHGKDDENDSLSFDVETYSLYKDGIE